jgi:CubicO group peptidase (beta-lactamase class C family)
MVICDSLSAANHDPICCSPGLRHDCPIVEWRPSGQHSYIGGEGMTHSMVWRVGLAFLLTLGSLGAASAAFAEAETVQSAAYWPTEGWHTAKPESHGLSPDLPELIDQRLRTEAPLLSAFLVVKDGDIVVERYHESYDPEQPFHVWSVSKSITNIAVGLAQEEGLLTGLDQTLGELIPDRIPPEADPRVYDVTVEQLLTMTAGWAWDSRINFARFAETDDLDLMLTRPFQCDPGTCFEYDSGHSNILAYIIQEVSGEMMVDYLQPRLFEPLGIEKPEWIVTEDGANRGGGGAFLTAREMAKIGLLYLNGGRWEGERIVSLRWVSRSTSPQSSGISYLSGVNIGTGPYGYQWWVADASGHKAFAALGYGGQMIYVVPDLELVVVTAYAEIDPTRPDLQQRVRPIVEELVVPAAMHT